MLFIVLIMFIGQLIMFNACFSTFGYVMAFVFVEESRETREYQNKWQLLSIKIGIEHTSP